MPQQQSPFLEGKYGWNFGEGGWNTGMDENLLKFSFMFDRNVDSLVASLPPAVNGQAHYNTSDNRIYFAVGSTYFSTPVPKWFTVIVRSTGETWQYNGTSLVQIDTPEQLDVRLDAVELTVASLGTAAFEDVGFFATQAELDVVEANAQAYTDVLRQDLAENTDPLLGAGMVGRGIQVVKTLTELRALLKTSPSKFTFVTDVGHYLLDVADVSSADNGGTLIVANDGGRWKRIDGRRVTNQMWEGNGAIVERIGDRLLVGGAVKSDARYPNVEQDWLATYQSYFYPGNTPPTVSTLMNVLGSDTGPGSAQAFLAGAHSSSAGASGGNAIGVQGYGIANNLTFGGDFSWGFYGEGHRTHSGSGNCYGMEICVVNRGTVKALSPYFGEVGSTIGIQIDSGCGFRNTVMTDLASASAALVIVDNTGDAGHVGTAPFLSGIVFQDGSLSASSGFTAIALPLNYKVRWYTPSNSPASFISCVVTTASSAQGLLFTDFGTQITNNSQAPMVTVPVVANPVNFLQLNAAATGERVRVEAAGADANIDLGLDVKGAGHIRFGTYTAGAVAQAGYITIKDAGGTVRRLLVG